MAFETLIQPPAAWLCDTCEEQITDPANALVVWRGPGQDDGGREYHDFKIIAVLAPTRSGKKAQVTSRIVFPSPTGWSGRSHARALLAGRTLRKISIVG